VTLRITEADENALHERAQRRSSGRRRAPLHLLLEP
jgi:hypothetical protein